MDFAARAPKPPKQKRDVRSEDAAVRVRLVQDHHGEPTEERAPLLVVRQKRDVQGVGVGDEHAAARENTPTLLLGRVSVVRADVKRVISLVAAFRRARAHLVDFAELVARQRLGGEQVQRRRVRVAEQRLERRRVVARRLSGSGPGGDDDVVAAKRRRDRRRLVAKQRVRAHARRRERGDRDRGQNVNQRGAETRGAGGLIATVLHAPADRKVAGGAVRAGRRKKHAPRAQRVRARRDVLDERLDVERVAPLADAPPLFAAALRGSLLRVRLGARFCHASGGNGRRRESVNRPRIVLGARVPRGDHRRACSERLKPGARDARPGVVRGEALLIHQMVHLGDDQSAERGAKRGGGAFREGFAGDTASPIIFRRYFSRLRLLRVLRVSHRVRRSGRPRAVHDGASHGTRRVRVADVVVERASGRFVLGVTPRAGVGVKNLHQRVLHSVGRRGSRGVARTVTLDRPRLLRLRRGHHDATREPQRARAQTRGGAEVLQGRRAAHGGLNLRPRGPDALRPEKRDDRGCRVVRLGDALEARGEPGDALENPRGQLAVSAVATRFGRAGFFRFALTFWFWFWFWFWFGFLVRVPGGPEVHLHRLDGLPEALLGRAHRRGRGLVAEHRPHRVAGARRGVRVVASRRTFFFRSVQIFGGFFSARNDFVGARLLRCSLRSRARRRTRPRRRARVSSHGRGERISEGIVRVPVRDAVEAVVCFFVLGLAYVVARGAPGTRRRRQESVRVRRASSRPGRAHPSLRRRFLVFPLFFDARVAHDGERRVRGRRADRVAERRRAGDLAGGADEHARAASWLAERARDGGADLVHGRARRDAEGRGATCVGGEGTIGRRWRGVSALSRRGRDEEAPDAFAEIRARAMSSSLPTRTREVLRANAKGLARGVVRHAGLSSSDFRRAKPSRRGASGRPRARRAVFRDTTRACSSFVKLTKTRPVSPRQEVSLARARPR